MQTPAATAPVQDSPVPAVTVTLPVGVPAAAVTVNRTSTGCPTSDGSGASESIRVVVGTAWTSMEPELTGASCGEIHFSCAAD